MQRRIFYVWLLAMAIVAGACQNDSVSPASEEPVLRELSVPEAELVTTINTFAFDLIRDLVEHRPQDNVFLSPYSINLALSMTLNGAASTTFTNLRDGLEHDVMAPREINKAYSELTPFLQQLDQRVDFTLATALWHDRRLRAQPLSEDLLNAYYRAHVGELAFGRRKSPSIINKWVREQTGGQIDALVDELDPDASVYVTSAVQFSGDWSVPFRPEDTTPGFFYLPDGVKMTTDMMVAPRAQYRFFQDETKTIIDIPYGNEQYSMTLLMAQKQDSLQSLVNELEASSFRSYLAQMDTVTSTLYLPRFTIDYQASLKPTLSRLGMGMAFGDSANFNRLFTDTTASVSLSDVLHKAVINVNEVGTAATTSTVTQAKGATTTSTSLRVDRSFLFFIRESHSGVIVFAGRLNQPTVTTEP